MIENLKKPHAVIAILLILTLVTTVLFLPTLAQVASAIVLVVSIGMAIMMILRRHWESYQQAECTREKMIRNLAFDLLGLFLTMGAALYAGGQAGGYVGLRAGFWLGLAAAFLAGFAAAWAVRSAWGRWVRVGA